VYSLGGFATSFITPVDSASSGLISCQFITEGTNQVLMFEAAHIGGFQFTLPTTRRLLQSSGSLNSFIAARGAIGEAFGQHSQQSAFSMDLSGGSAVPVYSMNTILKTVHAFLMCIAFGWFLPLAIFFPVAFKHNKNWFLYHRICISLTIVTATVGFGLVVPTVLVPLSQRHHQLGLSVLILMWLQPINAMLRPHLPEGDVKVKSTKRKAWELLHKNIGRSVYVLALANIVLGVLDHGSAITPPLPANSQAAIFLTLAFVVTPLFLAVVTRAKITQFRNAANETALTAGAKKIEDL